MFFLIPATMLAMGVLTAHMSKNVQFLADAISIAIVMIPFYIGVDKQYKTRLKFGREYTQEKRWKEAVLCLKHYDTITQRFLDASGEAHYWLSLAYAGAGDKKNAERVRNFVLNKRKGPWADKLTVAPRPKASEIQQARERKTSRRATAVSEETASAGAAPVPDASGRQEKPAAPPKNKRRRRF